MFRRVKRGGGEGGGRRKREGDKGNVVIERDITHLLVAQ